MNLLKYLSYLEDAETHESNNELLQTAIDRHNDLDRYVRQYDQLIPIDERYFSNAINLYTRFLTFMEMNWKKIASQLGINLKDSFEMTHFKPASQYIERFLEDSRDNLETFSKKKSIHHLHGYTYLHHIIQFFKEFDIDY
jgi:hypothetical protein